MITFYFHRDKTLLGKTIRFVSRGNYNHVSIGINGYVYESNPTTGVTKRKIDNKYIDKVSFHHSFELDEEEVIYFLEEQIGKKYDFIGVLSFIWIFLKPRQGYWFCSEMAMVALMKGLNKIEYNEKQSPQDFYYILKILPIK